jgi:hypothetical protein
VGGGRRCHPTTPAGVWAEIPIPSESIDPTPPQPNPRARAGQVRRAAIAVAATVAVPAAGPAAARLAAALAAKARDRDGRTAAAALELLVQLPLDLICGAVSAQEWGDLVVVGLQACCGGRPDGGAAGPARVQAQRIGKWAGAPPALSDERGAAFVGHLAALLRTPDGSDGSLGGPAALAAAAWQPRWGKGGGGGRPAGVPGCRAALLLLLHSQAPWVGALLERAAAQLEAAAAARPDSAAVDEAGPDDMSDGCDGPAAGRRELQDGGAPAARPREQCRRHRSAAGSSDEDDWSSGGASGSGWKASGMRGDMRDADWLPGNSQQQALDHTASQDPSSATPGPCSPAPPVPGATACAAGLAALGGNWGGALAMEVVDEGEW